MKLDHQKSWRPPAVVTVESVTPHFFVIEKPRGKKSDATARHTLPFAPDELQQGATLQQPEPAVSSDIALPVPGIKSLVMQHGLLCKQSGRLSKPMDKLNL